MTARGRARRPGAAAPDTPASPPAPAAPAQPPDLTLLDADLRLAGRLDARFFALLRALRDTGSLRQAAQTAGYSYKGAWLVLEAAAAQSVSPLLDTATGGRGGGGSRLTASALALLAGWEALQRRHRQFLQAEEAMLLADPAFAGLLRRTALRTTARNQFAGTVAAVEADASTAHVQVSIAGGHRVTVSTPAQAAQALGIAPGREARVLVKASAVSIATPAQAERLSATNRLPGTVARVERGPVNALVGLVLPGGAAVTASVARDTVDGLGLRPGLPATAVFQSTSALLAVAG